MGSQHFSLKRRGKMKLNIFVFLIVAICVDIGMSMPLIRMKRQLGGTGPSFAFIRDKQSGVVGTNKLDTSGGLAATASVGSQVECKWFVNRRGRRTSQNCNSSCRCTSRLGSNKLGSSSRTSSFRRGSFEG